MRLMGRVALGAAVAAGAWTGIVGHWLPDWLRPRIEAAATEALGTPVQLGALRIHPWSLAVEADALAVGPTGQPWFKLQRAETQLSVQSLWRMAPILRQVRLVQPELLLERQSADRFNLTAVIERLSKPSPQPQPDTGPARFAVFNIELIDGVLRYEDRVLTQSHRIDQLRLNVPFASSLPADVDVTVQPLLQARIDGSPLKVEGKTLPFREGHRSEVAVQWQAVDLAHWLGAAKALLPEAMRPDARAGRLDTDLHIVFEQHKSPAPPTLAVRGQARVSRFDIGLPPAPGVGRVDAGWDTLRIDGIDAEPLARRVAIASVALDGLSVQVRPDTASRAAPAGASSADSGKPEAAKPVDAPWQWSVGKLHVAARQIDAQTQAEAAWPRLTQVLLDVQGLDGHARPVQKAQRGRIDHRGGRAWVQQGHRDTEVFVDPAQLAEIGELTRTGDITNRRKQRVLDDGAEEHVRAELTRAHLGFARKGTKAVQVFDLERLPFSIGQSADGSARNVRLNQVATVSVPESRMLLLILGLGLSIPLIIFGSQVLMGVMERFPIIITLGAALLGWVAGEMLLTDPGLKSFFASVPTAAHWLIKGAAAAAVVAVGRWLSKRQADRAAQPEEGTGTTP